MSLETHPTIEIAPEMMMFSPASMDMQIDAIAASSMSAAPAGEIINQSRELEATMGEFRKQNVQSEMVDADLPAGPSSQVAAVTVSDNPLISR